MTAVVSPQNIAPFELSVTTRGYETDFTGTVGMPIIFRFFEHKRWMMMRDPRLGIVDLVHDGHFFVVRAQAVEIHRHLGQGTPLTLSTRFIHVGRSTATVLHEARRTADGVRVAQAEVTGVWIAPNRRMARLPDTFRVFARAQANLPRASDDEPDPAPTGGATGSLFSPPEVRHPPLGLNVSAKDLVRPATPYLHTLTVPPRDIDIFSHVNAATWLRYIDDARHHAATADYLPLTMGAAGYNVRTAIHYHQEAVVGDPLTVSLWRLPDAPQALGAAVHRAGSPEPCVYVRMDLQPGARPISQALTQ